MAFDLYMYGVGFWRRFSLHSIEPWLVGDGPLQSGVWKCDWSTTVVLLGARPTLLDPRLSISMVASYEPSVALFSIHTWAVYLLAEASIRLVIGKLKPV
jgi:hypothetical protein